MGDVPYPLTADDTQELKRQIWELIRQLFEDKIGGLEIGDVFSDSGGIINLNVSTLSGLQKVGGYLLVKLDGSSLTVTTSGLRVGQSAHIANADGSLGDATTKINAILSLLEARGLMASS
jgi:hypothetical protein